MMSIESPIVLKSEKEIKLQEASELKTKENGRK